jgi:hypothetical protein
MTSNGLADLDDLVGMALDRFVDPSLQLVARHGVFALRLLVLPRSAGLA